MYITLYLFNVLLYTEMRRQGMHAVSVQVRGKKTTEKQGLGATHLDDCLSVVSVRYFSMSYWPGLTFISWKWCQKFPIIRNFIRSKDSAIKFA